MTLLRVHLVPDQLVYRLRGRLGIGGRENESERRGGREGG